MDIFRLENFVRGWIVGNFEPSLLKTNFEVGITTHQAGEKHQDHFHKNSTEINVLLQGEMIVNGKKIVQGDIFILHPYEVSIVEFITDVTVIVIRDKSDPFDKFLL